MSDPLQSLASALSNRYTIKRELGAGGMATVYLAEDVKHRRKVAVKVLRPELCAVLGTERFQREIEIAASLSHPNILQLLDSGIAEEQPTALPPDRRTADVPSARPSDRPSAFLYYVMPYIEGDTLRDRMNRDGQLSIDDSIKITEQIAGALEHAHRRDVIHRDIKPENILFHEGVAMVADFGIALAVKSAGGERLTETGLSLGTPSYMSPEQVSGDREIDGRSDVYSLACVLYEMLAGEPPFTGPNAQAIVARHMTDPVPPITTVRSSVPQPVAAAITKALGKAPIDRFESAKAFVEALFAESAEAEPEVKSIVVLPFENLSPDPEQEYFSDGLTEEVISDLSKVHALHVISRSSAMTFKGSVKKIPEIAQELNVHYVLEGSVRKAGNNLRITAQLIEAATDVHLWTDKYDGTLDDVFDMQEKVARAIVEALQVKLTPEESRRVAHRPTTNVHAYECYMRARAALHTYTKEGHDSAIRHIESGLGMTGDNALLLAGLAYVYAWWGNTGVIEAEESYEKAETYAKKALALDPEIAQAHLALGMVQCYLRWDIRRAYQEFERAATLDPSDWDTRLQLAFFYISVGRLPRALQHAHTMVELDPTNPVGQAMVGYVHMLEGQADRAVEIMEGAGMDLRLPWHAVWIAAAYLYANRNEVAVGVLDAIETGPELDFMAWACLMWRAALHGDKEAFDHAKTSQCYGVCERDPAAAWYIADAHVVLGDIDGALGLYERAVDVGWINYPVLAETDPLIEPVRLEPRFRALLERVKREWEEFGRELEDGGAP